MPSPSTSARIAVVSVSYGSEEVLPTLLRSVTGASTEPLYVAIADNKASGTTDQHADTVKHLAESHDAHYLPMPSNLGYGGAINAAVQTLPEEIQWILVANPDLVFAQGSIDTLLAAGEADQHVGAVGPATMTSDGLLYPSARAIPSLRTGIGHALFANLWVSNPWTRAYRNDTTATPVRRDTGWLSGACLLIRRTAFEEIGGFDPDFFMYFEDVDLGYRLGKAGYRNVYEPAAVVTHTGAHSTRSDAHGMISAHHDSARRFLEKKYSGPLLWPVRVCLTLGLKARSALIRRKVRRD